MATTKNAPRRPRTKAGKPKPRDWIVNLGDLTEPPYPLGTPIDVVRHDGRREDGVPCGLVSHMTRGAFLRTMVDSEWPSAIRLYRLHDPSDPAPKPRAKKAAPVSDDAKPAPQYDSVVWDYRLPMVPQADRPLVAERFLKGRMAGPSAAAADELPRSMTGLSPEPEPVADYDADSFAVFAWTCLLVAAIAVTAYGAYRAAQTLGVLP